MILITILVAKQQRSYKMKIENAQYIEDLEDKMIKASIDGVVWNVPLDPKQYALCRNTKTSRCRHLNY